MSIVQINLSKGVIEKVFENFNDVLKIHRTFNIREIIKCLKGEMLYVYSFGWIYEANLDKIDIKKYCEDRNDKKYKLFINQYPELVKEVSPNNINLNIETLTYKSGKRITWICLKNSDHCEYTTSVYNRTNSKNPTGCKNCYLDSVRKFDKKIKQNHIDNYIPNLKKSVSIGDDSEIFIANLLQDTNFFKKIERTG
jgi:hypothetical protein